MFLISNIIHKNFLRFRPNQC